MKKIAIALTVFCWLLAGSAFAASLICAPQANVTTYRIIGLDSAREIVAAESDGSVRYDLAGLSPGPYNATIEAGWPYVLDGVPQTAINWSTPPLPFVLTVPATPVALSGLAIE